MPAFHLIPRTSVVAHGPTDSATAQTNGDSGIPIGAIVGGAVTGVLLTLLVTIGWKYWGYRLMQPVTKKPAHLRIPGEKATRPTSTHSKLSLGVSRTSVGWKTRIATPPPAASPTKVQKYLLTTTPAPAPGRFSPTSKLAAIQEESNSSHGHGHRRPRTPSNLTTSDLGKDSVRFPHIGAPQQVQVKYVSAVTATSAYNGYDGSVTDKSFSDEYSGVRLSRTSSMYSNEESEGQVHHLSYLGHAPLRHY